MSTNAGERADRVRAAADARDDDVGIVAVEQLAALRARFVADDALELAHHPRERVRAHRGTDAVVRRLDDSRPTPRIASLTASFSVALPDCTGHDLGAEQLHAPDVERLALDVDRAHVDGAAEPEQRRAGRGRRRRAGRRPSRRSPAACPCAASAGLTEHVVDLVRAGVREVLALQQHPHAEPLRQPVALGDRRGPARRSSTSSDAYSARNASSDHASRKSTSSCASAGTSVSGAKRPPNSPKRPSPTGSGPGGSRCTARTALRELTSASIVRGMRTRRIATGSSCDRPAFSRRAASRTAGSRRRAASRRSSRRRLVARLDGRSARRRDRRRRRRGARRLDEPPQLARILAARRAASTPLDTSTPHGRTSRIASPTLCGGEPAGEQEAHAARRALGEPPVEHPARTGIGRVDEDHVGRAVRRGRERGIAGRERLDHELHPLADPLHLGRAARAPCSCTACSPARADDRRRRARAARRGTRRRCAPRAAAAARCRGRSSGFTCRRLGANTKPSASAPSATASSASSSLVIPQILTNTRALPGFMRRSGGRG